MAIIREVKAAKLLMGKLAHGADLLEEITKICVDHDIYLGRVEALGAVKKARLGYYNQHVQEYHFYDLNQTLEITTLTGNISIKDGVPVVHAHITLSDKDGHAYGGHLAPGTIIFACEVVIQVLNGPMFERGLDQETGLPLWKMNE
ncbi:DNA-binding protein [Candidatus Scalindua japonica]|uniref:DNA-binding protein n=1 Tax=Candidatus Scalindua japonica TaxID=1284222 RepID=A0A286U258_9BACT|nr:PPC domain-containing DNA-binding protein [Candidatus Scalindua japonica]GAX62205.1 DNA-binding protein [Candidatus Scalindua japonica]